jgi:hypothetical protein
VTNFWPILSKTYQVLWPKLWYDNSLWICCENVHHRQTYIRITDVWTLYTPKTVYYHFWYLTAIQCSTKVLS